MLHNKYFIQITQKDIKYFFIWVESYSNKQQISLVSKLERQQLKEVFLLPLLVPVVKAIPYPLGVYPLLRPKTFLHPVSLLILVNCVI